MQRSALIADVPPNSRSRTDEMAKRIGGILSSRLDDGSTDRGESPSELPGQQ
jgi:hypothetical protein